MGSPPHCTLGSSISLSFLARFPGRHHPPLRRLASTSPPARTPEPSQDPRSLSENPVLQSRSSLVLMPSRRGSTRVGPAPTPLGPEPACSRCLISACWTEEGLQAWATAGHILLSPTETEGQCRPHATPPPSGPGSRSARPATWAAGPAPLRPPREPHLARCSSARTSAALAPRSVTAQSRRRSPGRPSPGPWGLRGACGSFGTGRSTHTPAKDALTKEESSAARDG